jgi:hypothetical protein
MEVSWDDVGGSAENVFMTLEEGPNTVRVLSTQPKAISYHFQEFGGPRDRIICPGLNNKCVLCARGEQPVIRFAALVFDRKANKVRVLEGGKKVFGDMGKLYKTKGWGPLKEYDITIHRQGTGRMNTTYMVMPSPKEALAPEVMGVIKASIESGRFDLNRIYTPTAPEKVKEILSKPAPGTVGGAVPPVNQKQKGSQDQVGASIPPVWVGDPPGTIHKTASTMNPPGGSTATDDDFFKSL